MKRFLILPLTLCLCLGMVACTHVEDINGEQETGLATLTEDQLTAKTPNYNATFSVYSEGGESSSLKVKKFSGVNVLDSVRIKEGTSSVTFTASTELSAGNLSVYVYRDGRILGTLSLCQGATLTLQDPEAGEYELRVAGESAEFLVTYSIEVK